MKGIPRPPTQAQGPGQGRPKLSVQTFMQPRVGAPPPWPWSGQSWWGLFLVQEAPGAGRAGHYSPSSLARCLSQTHPRPALTD